MNRRYTTITEVLDFGPQITKVILDTGYALTGAVLTPKHFTVSVKRTAKEGEDFQWPVFMGAQPEDSMNGIREISSLYVSNREGEPDVNGSYITLELPCSPMKGISSIIRFNGTFNVFVDVAYTITQNLPLTTDTETITGMVFDKDGGNRIIYGEWLNTGSFSHPDAELTYAFYAPKAEPTEKNPLIIWLHGAGEGGVSPLIAAIGNKVVNLISPEIQQYFGGKALLLAPQAPTMWMDDGTGEYTTDGSSKYVNALDALILSFIKDHPEIDTKRIYIGGCSNGGFMTMKMILHTPDRYAAAFPVCEALNDAAIIEQQIQSIARLPIWFTHAVNDPVVPPQHFATPTYKRIKAAGNPNVHYSLFDNVIDLSGTFQNPDGTPYEYIGHWTWIYTLNNACTLDYDKTPVLLNGKPTTIMEWLAAQKKA